MARRIVTATTILLTVTVLAIVVTAALLYVQLRTDSVSTILEDNGTLQALVVAHRDNDPFLSFVFFLDANTNRAAVLDIPGSVGAVLRPLGRVDGIDAVFNADNPELYRREVENLTGVSIPLVFLFSYEQLARFIDLLGGMELFIITNFREMDGADPVLLPSGSTHLDGDKSVRYLTQQAGTEIDLEQVGRRQTFVQALLRAIHRNVSFLNHDDVTAIRDRLITTEVESRGVSTFIGMIGTLEPERIVRRRIQGTIRQVDVNGVARDLLFPHFEGQWLKQSVEQIRQTLASPDTESAMDASIALEVLNGTSRTGLARRTAELFEGYGFEVRNVGNAESGSIEHTVIVDRRGIGDLAERVADVIEGRRVVTEVRPEGDVDVTVILGGDFDGTRVRTEGQ